MIRQVTHQPAPEDLAEAREVVRRYQDILTLMTWHDLTWRDSCVAYEAGIPTPGDLIQTEKLPPITLAGIMIQEACDIKKACEIYKKIIAEA